MARNTALRHETARQPQEASIARTPKASPPVPSEDAPRPRRVPKTAPAAKPAPRSRATAAPEPAALKRAVKAPAARAAKPAAAAATAPKRATKSVAGAAPKAAPKRSTAAPEPAKDQRATKTAAEAPAARSPAAPAAKAAPKRAAKPMAEAPVKPKAKAAPKRAPAGSARVTAVPRTRGAKAAAAPALTAPKPPAAPRPARRTRPPKVAPDRLEQLVAAAAKSLEDDKAEDIRILDVTGRADYADRLIIATGLVDRQIQAMATHLVEALGEVGLRLKRDSIQASPDWVLIDALDLVIHLFKPEARALYGLERMWGPDSPASDGVTPAAP